MKKFVMRALPLGAVLACLFVGSASAAVTPLGTSVVAHPIPPSQAPAIHVPAPPAWAKSSALRSRPRWRSHVANWNCYGGGSFTAYGGGTVGTSSYTYGGGCGPMNSGVSVTDYLTSLSGAFLKGTGWVANAIPGWYGFNDYGVPAGWYTAYAYQLFYAKQYSIFSPGAGGGCVFVSYPWEVECVESVSIYVS